MIIVKNYLKEPMAVEYQEGLDFANEVLGKYNKEGIVELDFAGVVAWNTAFFNGLIFKIISKMTYQEFLDKKIFKLKNASDSAKRTLGQSLELAELKFS